jgi:hypothetical protein
MHFAKYRSNGEGVCYVSFATAPKLALMGLLGIKICPPNAINLIIAKIAT